MKKGGKVKKVRIVLLVAIFVIAASPAPSAPAPSVEIVIGSGVPGVWLDEARLRGTELVLEVRAAAHPGLLRFRAVERAPYRSFDLGDVPWQASPGAPVEATLVLQLTRAPVRGAALQLVVSVESEEAVALVPLLGGRVDVVRGAACGAPPVKIDAAVIRDRITALTPEVPRGLWPLWGVVSSTADRELPQMMADVIEHARCRSAAPPPANPDTVPDEEIKAWLLAYVLGGETVLDRLLRPIAAEIPASALAWGWRESVALKRAAVSTRPK